MVACKHFYKAKCPSSKYHLYFLVWYACGLFRREKCGICDTIKKKKKKEERKIETVTKLKKKRRAKHKQVRNKDC
jgi:hypothetical protein